MVLVESGEAKPWLWPLFFSRLILHSPQVSLWNQGRWGKRFIPIVSWADQVEYLKKIILFGLWFNLWHYGNIELKEMQPFELTHKMSSPP